MKRILTSSQEAFFLVVCAAILIWKLLLPGFIGMASNGDFGKVIGALCIDGTDHSANNFVYFQSDYVRGPEYCFSPPIASSELALAWVASSVQQVFGDRTRFDIRWQGAIHLLLFLGFYYTVLVLLRPLATLARILLSLAALWIFADIGLIAYLNSFFTDTTAFLGGLTAAILAIQLISSDKMGGAPLALFGLAALLFILSKGQHGLLGFVPATFAIALAWRAPNKAIRVTAAVVAIALLSGMAWAVIKTPGSYTAQSRFNLIFSNLSLHSETPTRDLLELGLDPGDVRYAGLNAYNPPTPMADAEWRNYFYSRSTYGGVLRFYLRRPDRMLRKLRTDLWDEARKRRQANLSNYRRDYGKPAGARDPQLGSWSALRSRLFKWCPAHILVWLGLAVFVPPFLVRGVRSRFQRSVAWAIPVIALLAAAEFCISSLADAIETDRHLLMFHVFTDLTFFLAMVLGASLVGNPGSDPANRSASPR